jgi:outer membrane protein OmpA-like peptidoglycan-associated protein
MEGKTMHEDSATLTNPTRSIQLPSNIVMPEFGEVNVRGTSDETFVDFTILMEPQGKYAEGWRTGIALDASGSMKRSYGRKVSGRIDPAVLTKYVKKGLLKSYIEDGEPIRSLKKSAYEEIQQEGYVFRPSPNILQPIAQEFTSYLANSLDGVGRTALIYWGCGKGDETQAIGEFNAAECLNLSITGPSNLKLGNATKLMPAIAYFTEQYPEAKRGLFLFITDGRIDDLEAVKQYTLQLAQDIASGKRNFVKFILIGVGDGIDRYQLRELDDFDTGTDIDIWDYKIAEEMQSLVQIFSEVIGEQQIVADRGAIYSPQGDCVKLYADGLPSHASFTMPAGSEWFELEVSGKRIRQTVLVDESMAIVPLLKNTEASTSRGFGQWKSGCVWLAAGFVLLGGAIAYAIFNSGINPFANPNPTTEQLSGQNQNPTVNASTPPTTIAGIKTELKTETKSIPPNQAPSLSGSPTNPSSHSSNPAIAQIPTNQAPASSLSKPSSLSGTNKNPNHGNPSTQQRDKGLTTSIPPSPTSVKQEAKSPIAGLNHSDLQVVLYFSADGANLTSTEAVKLKEFWSQIKSQKGVISVKGYTDSYGENTYNLELSNARANEIIVRLKSLGLNENHKFTLEALGDLNPIKDNVTDVGRAFNRRVVVSFKVL